MIVLERFTFEKGATRGGGSAARSEVSGKAAFSEKRQNAWFEMHSVSNGKCFSSSGMTGLFYPGLSCFRENPAKHVICRTSFKCMQEGHSDVYHKQDEH